MGDVLPQAASHGGGAFVLGTSDLASKTKKLGDVLKKPLFIDGNVAGEKGNLVVKVEGDVGGTASGGELAKTPALQDRWELPQKVIPAIPGSSSTEPDTPPPSNTTATKLFLPPKVEIVQQQEYRQRPPSRSFKRGEIVRVGSAAESVVDSWTPDVAGNNPFDTAPYNGDDGEQPTVRLARPASKRRNVPAFTESFSTVDDGEAGAGGTFDATNPLYDALSLRRPASKRGRIPVFIREAFESREGETGEEGAFHSTNPMYRSSGGVSVLSPIPSVLSNNNAVVEWNKPLSLDNLRFDGQGKVEGVFFKDPANPAEHGTTAPSSRSPASAFASNDDSSGADADEEYSSSTEGEERVSPTPEYRGVLTDSHAVVSLKEQAAITAGEGPVVTLPTQRLEDSAVAGNGTPATDEFEVSHLFCFDRNSSSRMAKLAAESLANDGRVVERDSTGAIITDNRISPFDADNASLWATAAAAAAAAAAATSHRRSASNLSSVSGGGRSRTSSTSGDVAPEIVSQAWKVLRRVGLARSTAKVAPVRTMPRPPAPESSASPLPLFIGKKPDLTVDGPEKGRAPSFGADGILGKTPLVTPLRTDSSDEDTVDGTSSSTASDASPRGRLGARAELEVEGDLEDGGVRASVRVAASARVAPADGTRVQAAVEEGPMMVLPCSPTDEEKISYYTTGRFGLITCALMSFITLTTGMCLFTIVTPAFYWFGGPTVFFIIYLACHYFGVAMWGKDFCPEKHADMLRRFEEGSERPTVDVFLPVCKEPTYLLANTWTYVAALDYQHVNVYVLDDGASEDVRALAKEFGFNYIRRTNAPELKKAGNLRYAFAETSGDAIAIFDADFCPRPDFLKETVPYLVEDASVGIVQTPQYFRYRDEQTWIEKGAGVTQEFFYRMVQVNQNKFNAAVCVGSCGLYRRAALEPFGGMAAIAHSEDMYTGYKMTEHGYSITYVPLPLAMGACPDEPQSFFMQQYRWCMGSATLVLEKEFWNSSISRLHKLCFLNGMLYYVATALLVFLAPVPILLLVWMRADGVLWFHSAFTVPSLVFAGIVMPCWSKQPYGMACHRVKIIQCYAHMYAIKDRLMGRSAPWVPSGSGGSRAASVTYKSSVRLMVTWNMIITVLIVGGSAWRMTSHTWFHFVPAMALAAGSFVLSMSTLFY